MESHPPSKNQKQEEHPGGNQKKPPRFRLVRLEERIAPKQPYREPTKQCAWTHTLCRYDCTW